MNNFHDKVQSEREIYLKYVGGSGYFAIVPVPVSYTHLDVYKRQDKVLGDTVDNQ